MNDLVVRTESWSKTERILLKSFGAAAFALLTILAAQIRIPLPFTPIPMTLQTFIVGLSGGFLGAAWGGASMLLYLLLGMAGFNDIFAVASGGFAFFLAPSVGYLIGFMPAAAIVGWIQDRRKTNIWLLGSLFLSHILIFTFGVLGLMFNAHMTLMEAIAKGVMPFLIGDTIKITATFLVLVSYNHFRPMK